VHIEIMPEVSNAEISINLNKCDGFERMVRECESLFMKRINTLLQVGKKADPRHQKNLVKKWRRLSEIERIESRRLRRRGLIRGTNADIIERLMIMRRFSNHRVDIVLFVQQKALVRSAYVGITITLVAPD